ncbi:putative amidoligase domain-containing protein [Paenibacillus sp. MMS20-IR301]|uniref:putative amidoligase domain-containing protein n=1 Tax=Paenibacillus sp. MMS20-IR301 TaxID=2895946 RepID=UPI0028ED82AD|nr:hypothetical protein [Paenibacillus sp. MMS20-IR301]WNS44958.1 hypothetical protein LOS79_06715 [Paenibacillus sp. MMS20-IR301]
MNEGIEVFRQLTPEGIIARLERCGIESGPGLAGKLRRANNRSSFGGNGKVSTNPGRQVPGSYKQHYRVLVFNLCVLECRGLGAGTLGGVIHTGNLRPESGGIKRGTGAYADGQGRESPERGERSRIEIRNRAYAEGRNQGAAERGMSSEAEGGYAADVEERHGLGAGDNGAISIDNYGSGSGTGSGGGAPAPRGTIGILHSTAVRTLYSLGLDSGEVELRALGGRRYAVTGIKPLMPAAGEPLPQPYRSAAQALDRALALEPPGRTGLLMGMDPEFLLLRESTGRVVPASRYLPTDGIAGCDAGPPGTYGVFPVAELRPAPRGEPRALLAQLMSAAAQADRLIADRSLRWRAGGMPLPGWALGGHLHFSGVTLCAPLLRALDNYLALPMMLLEDDRAAARRPRYGVLGDFRRQPHGGFEYRTLPSFLVSPVIAKGAVCLAHLIVSHYEDLPLRPLDREDLHAAFYSGNKAPLRAVWPQLEAQLRALGGYSAAARSVDPLLRSIAAQQTWDESRDIRSLWRTAPPVNALPQEVRR